MSIHPVAADASILARAERVRLPGEWLNLFDLAAFACSLSVHLHIVLLEESGALRARSVQEWLRATLVDGDAGALGVDSWSTWEPMYLVPCHSDYTTVGSIESMNHWIPAMVDGSFNEAVWQRAERRRHTSAVTALVAQYRRLDGDDPTAEEQDIGLGPARARGH